MARYSRSECVAIEDVEVVRETEKALLCAFELKNGRQELWIPKSQIHDDSEVYEEDTEGVLVIPEWLAIEKGLV